MLSKLEIFLKLHWGKLEDQTGVGCELQILINCRHDSQVGAQQLVHLVGIGGRELSVGRLAGCRSPFTESTLTALDL